VKNEGQNQKVKKMRAKSQLHFKAGVRTPKNLYIYMYLFGSETNLKEVCMVGHC
jgi:hypothetical protein